MKQIKYKLNVGKHITYKVEGKEITYYLVINLKLNRKLAEKVFSVNLTDREYRASIMGSQVEITFFEKDNVFGWIEKISLTNFIKRINQEGYALDGLKT